MAFSFSNLGHAVATVGHEVVVVSKAVAKVAHLIKGQEDTIEAVTALVNPQAVEIERAAFFALGALGQALDSVNYAVDSKGVNVPLDQSAANDIKSLIAVIKAEIDKRGIVIAPPATPAA